MNYMKHRPRDRNPTSEILAEFAAIMADVARERSTATQSAPNAAQDTGQNHD
jgi:hypothetical protein